MEDITDRFNAVNAQQIPPQKLAQANKQKSVQFKASLAILIGFFSWLTLLHGVGIYFFTKGFLLTRLVLDEKSTCDNPPIDVAPHATGCWHPQTFEKAVVIIIDALRYDFTVPQPSSTHHAHNALRVLHQTALNTPENAFLLPFIADPPTATLQRLKGLTTGTLPTFVDLGSNFAGTAIEEDNLLVQLRDAGRTLVHLGDDTWHSLFPGYFDANLTHAYDSFNVWDLFTVDNGVKEHIFPLLESSKRERKWDVIFGHFLGLDHAGHRYGPDHAATHAKLEEMDEVIRQLIEALDEDTLLVVMGDHGMDVKGDHGGESDDEVEAALWMYSKRAKFGRGHNQAMSPPATAKERPVGQIDLVPTLALLLGIPIPYNNLGAPIAEAFVGAGKPDWKNLATANALAAAQIHGYQKAYSEARGLHDNVFSTASKAWKAGTDSGKHAQKGDSRSFETTFNHFTKYQQENLAVCRSLWARFDIPSMIIGIAILGSSLAILTFFARTTSPAGATAAPLYLPPMAVGGLAASILGLTLGFVLHKSFSLDLVVGGLGFGSISGFIITFLQLPLEKTIPYPSSLWGWMSFIFTIAQSGGFAANSFTIWEDEILLFFLVTFGAISLLSSSRRASPQDRHLGIAQSLTFALLTRLASFSRLCREEQMPYCKSTYYASTTSSTSSGWQLALPFLTANLLPYLLRSYYYNQTLSYTPAAKIWLTFALRTSLLLIATFWILDSADDNDFFPSLASTTLLKTTKTVLARLILGVSLIGGTSAWLYTKPLITISVSQRYSDAETPTNASAVSIAGSTNAHGTRFHLLTLCFFVALSLLQKPMGILSLSLLCLQILSLASILSSNKLSHSPIGPIILAMLGNYHFFKTGHQATLSSIQWESAFIPLSTVTYPFSPLLVFANTYGAQILTAASIPLLVLWRQPPRTPSILLKVAKAAGTFVSYHATVNLATCMWAGHLRRHLMLFRIFSPRFMTGVGALVVVDLVVVCVSLGGLWANTSSVAEIFGWV